nr:serine hydrolase domain-containing protein [Luteibacter rhizovicinus]
MNRYTRILATFVVTCVVGLASAQVAQPLTSTPAAAAPLPTPATATQAGAPPAVTNEDLSTFFDGLLPFALGRGDVAGAVVSVVKDGKLVFAKGYGYADLKTLAPPSPETTLFRPGSTSKLFAWTAVMQLVEQGKLDLDKDVNTYLDFTIPPLDGKPITLRDVMTHSAGFEESAKGLITAGDKQDALGNK